MMAGPLIPLTPLTEDAAICEGGICALPGAAAQGLAWGIMAIGVYITFRILDVAEIGRASCRERVSSPV